MAKCNQLTPVSFKALRIKRLAVLTVNEQFLLIQTITCRVGRNSLTFCRPNYSVK